MEKVKVSKEVAESIQRARRDYATFSTIVKAKAKGEVFPDIYDGINEISLDDLIRALYIGLEVEQTPEDKVREYYREMQNQMPNSHAAQSVDTIVHVLNLLNIKLDGVNA